jgi:DNA-directed RNA polymerase specialized sigma24 family protein
MAASSDAEVYRKYADELIRFCSALAGPSGAEDLLATAFVKALATPRWAAVDNKRAYLYRVVLNEAVRARRDTSRRLEREARTSVTEAVHSSAADVDVIAALVRLSVRQRAVVFLTYWADLPPK